MPKTCQTNLVTVTEVCCVTVKAGRHCDYHSRQSTGPSSPTVCYHRIISSLLEGQQDVRDLVTWEGSEQAQQRLCLQWTPFVGKVEIFVLVSTTKEQIVVCNHTDRQETKSYLVFPSTHTKGLHAASTVIGNSRSQLNCCLAVRRQWTGSTETLSPMNAIRQQSRNLCSCFDNQRTNSCLQPYRQTRD